MSLKYQSSHKKNILLWEDSCFISKEYLSFLLDDTLFYFIFNERKDVYCTFIV